MTLVSGLLRAVERSMWAQHGSKLAVVRTDCKATLAYCYVSKQATNKSGTRIARSECVLVITS